MAPGWRSRRHALAGCWQNMATGIILSLLQKSFNVIPAKAGIQVFQGPLDRGCHRSDGFVEFCKRLYVIEINET